MHPSPVAFTSTVLSAVTASRYQPYTNDDDDDDDEDDEDDEWATVQMREADAAGDVGVPRSSFDPPPPPKGHSSSSIKDFSDSSVAFSSVISEMRQNESVSARLTQIQGSSSPSSPPSGCGAFLRRLGFPGAGPPPLSPSASSSRDFLLCLAATPFDDDDPLHLRILRTLYQHLRPRDFSSASAIKRFGKHWEEIGFQGANPSTDLRGGGMLGLVCLLNWFADEGSTRVAQRIYQLSLDPVQNFPFCVTSINVTRMCLQELKRDNLNREIVRAERSTAKVGRYSDDVDACLSTFMLFYQSLFYRLFIEWRDGRKTIADSGFVLKSLESIWAKNPSKCIVGFQKGAKNVEGQSKSAQNSEQRVVKGKNKTGKRETADSVATFTNLSDL